MGPDAMIFVFWMLSFKPTFSLSSFTLVWWAGKCLTTRSLEKKSKQKFWFVLEQSYKSEKAGLKLNIQKMKIMASGPITSWEIDGETVETVSDFIFGAPKSLQMVTAAKKLKDAYSLEEKLWPT